MVADRGREVADVSDWYSSLFCEEVRKRFAEPRADREHERVGAEGGSRVEADRLEPAIRDS